VGALLLLDLDNFKSINDSLGHACGDLLLQAVVVRLKSLPQENLVLARTSGDEFALLFTALGQGYITAKILAEHFARELMGIFRAPSTSGSQAALQRLRGDQPLLDDDKDHLVLMQQADTAVHMAKRAGQGNHVFFSEAMAEREEQAFAQQPAARCPAPPRAAAALSAPIPGRQRHAVGHRGAAALAAQRRQHGAAGEFIPIAEETSLIRRSATG
jgi:diguanylate cyclase (GGDEF)-like protein